MPKPRFFDRHAARLREHRQPRERRRRGATNAAIDDGRHLLRRSHERPSQDEVENDAEDDGDDEADEQPPQQLLEHVRCEIVDCRSNFGFTSFNKSAISHLTSEIVSCALP
jgi:hypothetical protein